MTTEYDIHPTGATPESILVEKQLAWAIGTIRNPKIRRAERLCLLLLAGEILISFLGRDTREVGK